LEQWHVCVQASVYLNELQRYRRTFIKLHNKHGNIARMIWIFVVWMKRLLPLPIDSIDYAVMNILRRRCVTVDIGWNDIGSCHHL